MCSGTNMIAVELSSTSWVRAGVQVADALLCVLRLCLHLDPAVNHVPQPWEERRCSQADGLHVEHLCSTHILFSLFITLTQRYVFVDFRESQAQTSCYQEEVQLTHPKITGK